MSDCLICNRIEQAKTEANPYLVRELETGYVVIGDHQRFKGYTLFLCKKHVTELHHLDREYMVKYLEEMALVSEACANAFDADKMNLESLGNGEAHLHFHIFPRKTGDMPIKGPAWWTPNEEMYSDEVIVSGKELSVLKENLEQELDKIF